MTKSNTGRSVEGRNKKTRVKTARGRSSSSTRWLQRQFNDQYVSRAKQLGYRSRAAWKLIQIDEKVKLLKNGQRVVDLGSAPGGWAQVVAERIKNGKIVAVDLLEMDPIQGVSIFRGDVTDQNLDRLIITELQGRPDIILSDMAAPTTGHRQTDHLRTMVLCEAAIQFAIEHLSLGGSFVSKVFQGGTQSDLLAKLNPLFDKIRHVKPDSSRKESPETYLVAKGFRKNPN
jgi:23S rRNA (uridine2552-2'-O)-methyltransferase